MPEALDKVKQFYAADELRHAKPVPGAHNGLKTLRDMGFSLIVVSARIMASEADSTEKWLEKHFDGTDADRVNIYILDGGVSKGCLNVLCSPLSLKKPLETMVATSGRPCKSFR